MGKEKDAEWLPPELHRDHDLDEAGTSQVVIQRFLNKQLPLLLKMKEQMDAGKTLTTGEVELLDRMLHRADQLNRFVGKHQEYSELAGKIISLIEEITDEALDNESRKDEG